MTTNAIGEEFNQHIFFTPDKQYFLFKCKIFILINSIVEKAPQYHSSELSINCLINIVFLALGIIQNGGSDARFRKLLGRQPNTFRDCSEFTMYFFIVFRGQRNSFSPFFQFFVLRSENSNFLFHCPQLPGLKVLLVTDLGHKLLFPLEWER